jgi:cbb3-type cytochrome oxidase maturation protein
MNILFVLVPLSLLLVVFAGWAFFWAVGNGQFDDLESSGWDAVLDDADGRAERGGPADD